MYVLSASNKRVNVQLVGKDKIQDKLSHFEELTSASVSYLGVSSPGVPCDIGATVPSKFYLHHYDFHAILVTNIESHFNISLFLDLFVMFLVKHIDTYSLIFI